MEEYEQMIQERKQQLLSSFQNPYEDCDQYEAIACKSDAQEHFTSFAQ